MARALALATGESRRDTRVHREDGYGSVTISKISQSFCSEDTSVLLGTGFMLNTEQEHNRVKSHWPWCSVGALVEILKRKKEKK